MDLTPKLPPGRANRKAKAFTAEIQRLRSAGYTFEAIRQTLLEVTGVDVSRATVKREAAKPPLLARAALPVHRVSMQQPSLSSTDVAVEDARLNPSTKSPPAGRSFAGDSRKGKVIAEAYMQDHVTNPLLREWALHEDRRD